MTLNGFQPLFGLVSSWGGLTVGAVGFPRAVGNIDVRESRNGGGSQSFDRFYGDLDGGYFIELFTGYDLYYSSSTNSFDGSFSIFFKYSHLRCESTLAGERTGTVPAQDTFDFLMHRSLYIVGAGVSLSFRSPL